MSERFLVYGDRWELLRIPLLPGAASLEVVVPGGARAGTVSVEVDGCPIAVRASRDGARISIEAGDLAVQAVLIVPLRAKVPVALDAQEDLIIARGERRVPVPLQYVGAARLLPGRSILRVPESVNLCTGFVGQVEIVNDGTAPLVGARVVLPVPDGVRCSGETWRREIVGRSRYAIVDVPALSVGERWVGALDIEIIHPVDAVTLFASVKAGDAVVADLTPIEVAVNLDRSVSLRIDVEPVVVRLSDSVCATVSIENGGGPLPDAVLRVSSPMLQTCELALGSMAVGEARRLRVALPVVTSRSGEWEAPVVAEILSAGEPVAREASSMRGRGDACMRVTGSLSESDASAAHRLIAEVSNAGDAPAQVRARIRLPDGVRAVIDSLTVDGEPRFELDGSVNLGDIDLGEVASQASRVIAVRVRSTQSQRAEITVRLKFGDSQIEHVVEGELSSGTARTVADAASPAVAEESATAPIAGGDEAMQAQDVQDEATSPADVPSNESSDDAVILPLRFPQLWSDLGARIAGDASDDFPLARFIVAALSWLPETSLPEVEGALADIRASVEALQSASYFAVRRGHFGASGGVVWNSEDFVAPVSAVYIGLDRAVPKDPLRALIDLIDAEGPASASVGALREALLDAYDACESEEAFLSPAPSVAAAARAVFLSIDEEAA